MTIRLLPGLGAELPWGKQPLRFGMALDEVAGIVTPHADLRDTLVFHSAWAKRLTCDDLEIGLFAGESDALLGVSARRGRDPDVAHMAVGLDDIDLFGWPVDEVIDALRDAGRDVRVTKHGAQVDRDLNLTWLAPPPPPAAEPWRKPPRRSSTTSASMPPAKGDPLRGRRPSPPAFRDPTAVPSAEGRVS